MNSDEPETLVRRPAPIVEQFRFAQPNEVALLEELQRRSALVSDYREQILAHSDAIQIPAQVVADRCARVAIGADRILGFSIVLPLADNLAELDGLFVEPEFMGHGVGRALLADAFSIAREQGLRRIEVTSNPRAAGFYEKIGFLSDGPVPTRFAPALRMHIEIGSEGTDSVRADAGGRALETARLRLLPSYLRDCEALRLGAAAFRNKCGLAVAGGVTDFLHPASKDAVVALTWDSFLVIHRVERTLIGLCACQKRPDTAGAVEIAYGIAPDFRGKGLATETVRSLTQHVISRRDVKAVIAHTHPEFNASTRVLAKCGFTQVGEAMDSDEGRVWKWEFPRTDDGARN